MLTGEQMHEVTLFAQARDRMARSATANSGVELSADETKAMVSMIHSLTAQLQPRRRSAPPSPQDQP